jgi:hypothetical protein
MIICKALMRTLRKSKSPFMMSLSLKLLKIVKSLLDLLASNRLSVLLPRALLLVRQRVLLEKFLALLVVSP